ncbi:MULTISPECIES: alpha/beta hydrolase family protein [unclassified Chryseobacterium]|uniref:alpha/beta hydrolase family protein n=1 Tax=unclassified Chryseobacterium TaxID=2593645 RepID=UPI001AE47B48|nr:MULTISPECIES: alpha/beta fold hydrolase [unclassified Chryseobacterium]MBP1167518.1 putative alpha/beta hydrolase [Chryseobacterium sp. PvR013]MDR4893155.1 alpha/beta hydrolase [Chryseobacterium sp. CFS7]
MEKLILTTEDHVTLTAHLFKPEKDNGKLLLINSATGVKQQVYFSFASYFSEQGFTVITYDYRGIGLSKPKDMRGFHASMRLWGSKDYKSVTQYIKSTFKEHQKYCLGHSVGALILGMNEDSNIFEEFVFVGTQNAFVGNLKGMTKVEAYLGFGIAQPLTTSLLGYFPAHWFGLGESLPKNCAYDWRTLILNKKSTNRLLEKIDNFSENLTQKVFVIRAEDDVWLTEKGVLSLLNDTYPNLKPTYRLVNVSESDKKEIGHVNFFRSYNNKLWDIILNELIDK